MQTNQVDDIMIHSRHFSGTETFSCIEYRNGKAITLAAMRTAGYTLYIVISDDLRIVN